MFKYVSGIALIAVGALGLNALSLSAKETDSASAPSCINSDRADTVIIDESTILASRGNQRVVIKVDGCRLDDNEVLVFEYHGSPRICDRMDFQLTQMSRVGNGLGFPQACFVQSVTPVTKDEAKALMASR